MIRVRTLLVAAAAAALGLVGCARTPPADYPSGSPTATASEPTATATATDPAPTTSDPAPSADASTTPTQSATPATSSATPSATGSATPTTSGTSVKASGSLKLFFETSRKLAGSCSTSEGVPTLTGADRRNDFFGTVDASLVLTGNRTGVQKLTIDLGEDSEQISRTLTYTATEPAKGTSATLTVKGNAYTVTGKLAVSENGRDPSGTMPVTLKLTCADGKW